MRIVVCKSHVYNRYYLKLFKPEGNDFDSRYQRLPNISYSANCASII